MRPLVLALLLVGCGSAADPGPEGGGRSESESSGTETTTGDPVPESLVCATHDDCVLVPGVCGGVEPTHRTHEEETREGIRMRQSVASCMAPTSPEPVMVARCNAGQCMAIEPP